MVENYISLLLGLVEILFFSGIGFGFPFIQYILEDEFIFYEEVCADERDVLCQAAKEQYNTVFTCAIVGNVSIHISNCSYIVTVCRQWEQWGLGLCSKNGEYLWLG